MFDGFDPTLPRKPPSWVNDYIGIPFETHGRDHNGLDCWGLVRLVYEEKKGIILPSFTDVYDDIKQDNKSIAAEIRANMPRWEQVAHSTHDGLVWDKDPEALDVVVMNIGNRPLHVGLMVSKDCMLHIERGIESACEKINQTQWKSRIAGVFRYKAAVSDAPTETPQGVNVSATPHPFRLANVQKVVEPGRTLSEILNEVQPDPSLRKHAHVFIEDELIPPALWPRVKPKDGTLVTIRVVPMGGGGGDDKNPLRTVLSIAVLAAATVVSGGALAGVLGPSFAAGGLGATLGGAFIGIGGMLLVNAIAPVRPPSFNQRNPAGSIAESPTLFIAGARNQANPFGIIPRPFGTHRMVPPLGAFSYTEIAGDDQYLRLLLVWGYGPLAINDIKIGETLLTSFTDYEIETRQGFAADQPITLFPNDVFEDTLLGGVTIRAVDDDGNPTTTTRTSQTNADELSVDIVFPQGLKRYDGNGNLVSASVDVDLEYRKVGDINWIHVDNDPTYTFEVTAARSAAVRRTVRWTVSEPGEQFEVRMTRITADSTSTSVFDTVVWSALRTFSNEDPLNFDLPLAKTALRIKATDQLQQQIDQVNGVVTSLLPDWDGNSWVDDTATNNPASVFRAVLQGPGNRRPKTDSQIDLDSLQNWHDFCAANGYTYNRVHDYQASVWDVLSDVAAAGRASPAMIDGKYGVIIDEAQATPVQHFTPRNSFGFSMEKVYLDQPHAFRVRFINEDVGYRQDERLVYDDGYDASNATKFEGIEFPGITDPDLIWEFGRFHIAQGRLRSNRYTLNADFEHLVCTRGDLVRVTHPAISSTDAGITSGRIKALDTVIGTNLIWPSESLNDPNWTTENGTILVNDTTDPDGGSTADGLEADGLGVCRNYVDLSVTGGETYTMSTYVQAGTDAAYGVLDFADPTFAGFASGANLWVDLTGTAPAVGTVGGDIIDYGIEDVGGGWSRVWASAYCMTGGTARISFYNVESDGAFDTATSGRTIYYWGLMLNPDEIPGDYVVTTTAMATSNLITGVTVDGLLPMSTGTDYALAIRPTSGDDPITNQVVTVDGEQTSVTFTTPISATLGVAVGDLYGFGELDLVTRDFVVLSILPGADLVARIQLVDYAAALYESGVTSADFVPGDVDTGADTITITDNPFYDGDNVTFSTTNTLPSPLSSMTTYYVVNRTATTIQVSTSEGGSAENLTTQGVGTHTISRAIPGFTSVVAAVNTTKPDAPTISNIISDDEAMFYGTSGFLNAAIVANIAQPATGTPYVTQYQGMFRQTGQTDWRPVPAVPAENRQISFFPVTPGLSYDIRVRALAASGEVSDWTEALNQTVQGLTSPVKPMQNVTGLELFGTGHGTEFSGHSPKFVWRETSLTRVPEDDELEGEYGIGEGSTDIYFKDYFVRIKNPDGTIRREEAVLNPEYVYAFEDNALDGGTAGPARSFTIEVYQRGQYNQLSPTAAKLSVTNPAPARPTGLSIRPVTDQVLIDFNEPSDPDFVGAVIWAETSSGFDPLTTDPALEAVGNSFRIDLTENTTYYVRIGLYDEFGREPANLNITTEFEVTTVGLTALPEFAFDGLRFEPNDPSTNSVSWTAGNAHVTQNGSTNSYAISSGNVAWTSGTVYIYYQAGDTALSTATLVTDAVGVDKVILATYKGGTDLAVGNGDAFIDGARIIAQTITSSQLVTGVAVITETAQIANAIVDTANIANAAIETAKIDNLAVTTAKIANLAVDTAQIASAAITEAKIDNLAVTNAKIANTTITGAKIANATIDTAQIANAAITSALIDSLAVTTAKINDLAVDTLQVAGVAITTPKIADDAVSEFAEDYTSGTETFPDNTRTQTVVASLALADYTADKNIQIGGSFEYISESTSENDVDLIWYVTRSESSSEPSSPTSTSNGNTIIKQEQQVYNGSDISATTPVEVGFSFNHTVSFSDDYWLWLWVDVDNASVGNDILVDERRLNYTYFKV